MPSLLAELRELMREATEWAERERDPRAQAAAAAMRVAVHAGAMGNDPFVAAGSR